MQLDGTGSKQSGRRNIIVMRAGNNALFPDWLPAPCRTWDFAVSFYGDGHPDWGQDYFIAEKGPKWQPIHRWLTANPALLAHYDYFWFPDDDIMTCWENVNELFRICRTFDLKLAQPALTPDSFIAHPLLSREDQWLLRYTVFVEGMVPLFHTDALRLCLPVMQEDSRYGWGHDWVFPSILGYPDNKIAVVDACAVKHTRPVASGTSTAAALHEAKAVVDKYGARFMDHRIRGGILAEPDPSGRFVSYGQCFKTG